MYLDRNIRSAEWIAARAKCWRPDDVQPRRRSSIARQRPGARVHREPYTAGIVLWRVSCAVRDEYSRNPRSTAVANSERVA